MGIVVLRDMTDEALPILFEHQIDPVAHLMADFKPRDHDAFMAHWGKILIDASVVKKAIVVDGEVAGHVVCFDRDGKREVGYWIGREYWGKGIATTALSEFLAGVPERPLHAGVARRNRASIRVLEKCGFTIASEEPDDLLLVLEESSRRHS